MNNKELLLAKKKFIDQMLSRYRFWNGLVKYSPQQWTQNEVDVKINLIQGRLKPIELSSYEHLTILPLVFDYLDVTLALKYNLRTQPFTLKSQKLAQKLDQSFSSQLTIILYNIIYNIRNKLLHHKGGLSECGQYVVIIENELQVSLENLIYINSLVPFISTYLDGSKKFSLYEKSLLWSYFKKTELIEPDNKILLEAVKNEEIIEVNCHFRYKIDMHSIIYPTFEKLKNDLQNRQLNEYGNLISNTLFLFTFQHIEYAVPAEFIIKNPTFEFNEIKKWHI